MEQKILRKHNKVVVIKFRNIQYIPGTKQVSVVSQAGRKASLCMSGPQLYYLS